MAPLAKKKQLGQVLSMSLFFQEATSGGCSEYKSDDLHPGRLTWKLQITENYLPNLHEDMFHVNLQGCKIDII